MNVIHPKVDSRDSSCGSVLERPGPRMAARAGHVESSRCVTRTPAEVTPLAHHTSRGRGDCGLEGPARVHREGQAGAQQQEPIEPRKGTVQLPERSTRKPNRKGERTPATPKPKFIMPLAERTTEFGSPFGSVMWSKYDASPLRSAVRQSSFVKRKPISERPRRTDGWRYWLGIFHSATPCGSR